MIPQKDIIDFLDDEERKLFETIEDDNYTPGESLMTQELFEEAREAARNTLAETSKKVSIRIPQRDLARVKAQALREGILYQALIKSIIHKAVSR